MMVSIFAETLPSQSVKCLYVTKEDELGPTLSRQLCSAVAAAQSGHHCIAGVEVLSKEISGRSFGP